MRVLLIDIGNSRVKWRVVDPHLDWPQDDGVQSANSSSAHSPGGHSRHGCGSLALAELPLLAQHFDAIRDLALDAVHLSNVAGTEAEGVLRRAVSTAWGDVPIHALIPKAVQCGVGNGYRDKTQLGPDRWAALLGAHALLPDRHVLVCSFGTATTIDLLLSGAGAASGEATRAWFHGGLILPGFDAMRRSLARDTARLPLAQGEIVDFAIGTDDAIASGIAAAQTGAAMRALHDARVRAAARDRECGAIRPLACVLAGGGANLMAAYLSKPRSDLLTPMHVVPDLVLRGLHAIARESICNDDAGRVHPSTLVREHR